MGELDDLAKKKFECEEINHREIFRIVEEFPPKTHPTFDILIEEAVRKGNSNVKGTYYLDQNERVLVEVYYKKIIKADKIFFRHVRVRQVFAKLWKIQMEIEASNLSPRWKNLLIKLAEMRKFQVALHETNLVPKKFYWTPTRN